MKLIEWIKRKYQMLKGLYALWKMKRELEKTIKNLDGINLK